MVSVLQSKPAKQVKSPLPPARFALQHASPATFKAVLEDLAAGELSVAQIARQYGLDWMTVHRIRLKNGFTRVVEKEEQRNRWAAIVAQGTERLIERIPHMEDKTLAVVVGISSDKLALADGDPTQITQEIKTIQLETPNEYLARLKQVNSTGEQLVKSNDCVIQLAQVVDTPTLTAQSALCPVPSQSERGGATGGISWGVVS